MKTSSALFRGAVQKSSNLIAEHAKVLKENDRALQYWDKGLGDQFVMAPRQPESAGNARPPIASAT